MTTAADVRRLCDFDRGVLEAFERRLSRLPWRTVAKDRGATWHSMAGVYHHILRVQDGWLNYVAQGKETDEAASARRWDELGSMAELRAYRKAVWAGIDPLLDGLRDAGLRRKVRAPWQPKACTLEDAFFQVTIEEAHHLGEIIAMLWQEDIRPPDMTWLDIQWGLADRRRRA